MINTKNIALCIILTLVTCGIYGLYWVVCLADDVNTTTNRTGDTSGGMVLVFSLITCGIYSLYWLYKAGEKLDDFAVANGKAPKHLGIVYLVLQIFGLGIVSLALIQSTINEYAVQRQIEYNQF